MSETLKLCVVVAIALLAATVLSSIAGCSELTKVHNPVAPGYACGTRGVVCSESPLACCWIGEQCGAKGTSCPDGMCCYRGDDGTSFAAPQMPGRGKSTQSIVNERIR